jgi:hypothetical protein
MSYSTVVGGMKAAINVGCDGTFAETIDVPFV